MNWQETFVEECRKYQIDVLPTNSELLLVCPKLPDDTAQRELKALLPDGVNCRFQEGPRLHTTNTLKQLFSKAGLLSADLEIIKHKLVLKLRSDNPALSDEESEVWTLVRSILVEDTFVESYEVIVNDKVMAQYDKELARIVTLQKRPERDRGFNNDDLLNLKISLEACQDVNEFINSI